MGRFLFAYSLLITAALAFFLGRDFASKPDALEGMAFRPALSLPAVSPALPLSIQGRRPPSQGRAGSVKKSPKGTGPSTEAELLPYEEGSGGMAQGNGIIAVTASYGVGTSVLYVIDTNRKQMAVYEARGGSQGGRRLYLVGARRIDLDLQLEGYHDESEYSYQKLRLEFEKRGALSDDSSPEESDSGAEARK